MKLANNTLFKQKILSFTLIQLVLLSFLLVCSVALRIILYPHNYLEPVPLYVIVGFFFLGELFQLLHFTSIMQLRHDNVRRIFHRTLFIRILLSILVGVAVCFFLTGQHLFFSMLFLYFLIVELIFNLIYYNRLFRPRAKV